MRVSKLKFLLCFIYLARLTSWLSFGELYCGKGKALLIAWSVGKAKRRTGIGCQSNCDAKAECGRDAAEPGQLCPLNICCS